MATGNAPTIETSANSLQVSLPVLFLIATIVRFSPL